MSFVNKALKSVVCLTYTSAYVYGTKRGYDFAMVDWDNIKKRNIQLNTTERYAQYFHTSVLTLGGGICGCIFLTISPILIPGFYLLDRKK